MSIELRQRVKDLEADFSMLRALADHPPQKPCECAELKERLIKLEMQYRALNARMSRKLP